MTTRSRGAAGITFSLVGWLFAVELVSGILQGYYVPLVSDIVKYLRITDAEYNWFEAGQLLLSAIVLPILAKLGDMFGHKRILLIATVVTAGSSWWLAFAPDFTTYLIAFSLQGFYVVWLPLEVALIFERGRRSATGVSQTRRAAGTLVVALEVGAIVGALASGRILDATGSVPFALAIPAIAVTLVLFAILFGVPESEPLPGRRLDTWGFVILALALLLIMGGLTLVRTSGPGFWPVWALIALGLAACALFGWFELRQQDPAIDLRVMRRPEMWPVITTAGLVGISLLGAQTPLSTYAGTPMSNGYGLGMASSDRSTLIGVYLVSMIVGALLLPVFSRRFSPRAALLGASVLVAIGYLGQIPADLLAGELPGNGIAAVMGFICVAGIGSGALVAALPASAAAAAPQGQTGVASAMTNTTKTIGGSIASAVFGVVLLLGAGEVVTSTAASLGGYVTVWAICGAGAVLSAVLLLFVPRSAFRDPVSIAPSAQSTGEEGAAQPTREKGAAQPTGGRGSAQSTGEEDAARSTGGRGAAQSTGD